MNTYIQHFQTNHKQFLAKNNVPPLECKQKTCRQSFLTYNNLIRHLKVSHEVEQTTVPSRNCSSELSQPVVEEQLEDEKIPDTLPSRSYPYNPPMEGLPKDVSASAAKMVADLRTSIFTAENVRKIINITEPLMSDVTNYVQQIITEYMKAKNIDIDEDEDDLLNKCDLSHLFKNMQTPSGQTKTIKTSYKYIDPIEVPLGLRFDKKLNSKTQCWERQKVWETSQYVPIIETLKLIVSHASIREFINSEKDSDDDWLKSFRDGKTFKSHRFIQRFPQALRIQLYYDDFVVNNPLGSNVHPHKLGAFYFVIQNLPDHLNSFLGGIHVLGMCYTADIEKYGMKAVLQPFLKDLKLLESDEGVQMKINNEDYILRASIAEVCADGLAAHQMFGLLSPAASHFCRLCMVSREDYNNNTNLPAILRTKRLHDEQMKLIKGATTVKDCQAARTQSGVREESALHSSPYFHYTNNYVFDPMHDIFEGIASYVTKLVLHHFLTNFKKYKLTLDTLNSRLHLFGYGITDIKNKPSSNFTTASIYNLKDDKLSQSSAQMWCLMRVLPFILSDKVPEDDEYLQLILLLNRITEIVFAPKLRLSILPYLSQLFKDHENLFRELFPDHSLINKMHHLSHYPDCIRHSGPLRQLNCLRFEAKHALFKKYGNICCNFKNLPKSMINVCQISQCTTWERVFTAKKSGIHAQHAYTSR